MPRVSKLTKRARATGIIAGLVKHFLGASYSLGGKEYTRRQLVAEFQSHLDAIDEVDATRAALAAAVAKERKLARQVAALARYVKMSAESRFGHTHNHMCGLRLGGSEAARAENGESQTRGSEKGARDPQSTRDDGKATAKED